MTILLDPGEMTQIAISQQSLQFLKLQNPLSPQNSDEYQASRSVHNIEN